MTQLILTRAERLCLLTELHKARKAHRSTKGLNDRLTAVTARVAVLEARYG
jgi:hypothetical protein